VLLKKEADRTLSQSPFIQRRTFSHTHINKQFINANINETLSPARLFG